MLEGAGREFDEAAPHDLLGRETSGASVLRVGGVPDPRQLAGEGPLLELGLAVVDEVADEGVRERERLPDQDREGPGVREGGASRLAGDDLRRAVPRGVDRTPGVGVVREVVEVDQPGLVSRHGGGDEDVVVRDIAVHDASPMQPE